MRVDYLGIGDEDQMVRRGIIRPVLPLRPVASLDMAAKDGALSVMNRIKPDHDKYDQCQGESTKDRVLPGQGSQLVGEGMVQMHYVLSRSYMRTLISPVAKSRRWRFCGLRRVSSRIVPWRLRFEVTALAMQGGL